MQVKMKSMKLSPLVLLVAAVQGAQQVDLNNQNAVKNALQQMAGNMVGWLDKGLLREKDGNGPDAFQWYEIGLYTGIMMDYAQVSQDNQFSTKIINLVTAQSYGKIGSFLGSNPSIAEFGGKWNDDLLWHSMPALTGAQLYKKDTVMPGGVSYFQLAQTTYQQVMDQWDNSCGGGLFWIRSQTRRGRTRNGESYGYKSAITQSEAILHAAKLGMLTGDQKYLQDGDRIYKWMISSGLIAPNGDVFDGVDAAVDASKGQCTKANFILSYQKGMASGALALLAGASKNNAYLSTAHTIFQRAAQTFLRNNIVFDPCETAGKCDSNKATPKGTLVRGWGILFEYSNDEAIKAQIKMALRSTVQNMLKTCDASWNCGQDWLQGTPNGRL